MSETSSRSGEEKSSSDLDLSSLGDLSLGPDWGSGALPASKSPKWSEDRSSHSGHRDRRGGGGGTGPSRDRRAAKTRPMGAGQGGAERSEGRSFGEGQRRSGPPQGRRRDKQPERPFQPIIEADFYPDDNAFKALTQAIRQTFRTFELFEIARLILEKPERWVCVAKHPGQKEGEPAILHASVPDGLPFLSEQAAVDHVLKHHIGEFFEVEDFEAEAPTGNFQLVHKCGFTGEIIAPPNFHLYQSLLKQHQTTHLPTMSLEKVQSRLESVREQTAIDAWLEKMKQGRRYRLKGLPEGQEPVVFDNLDAARIYLLTSQKDKVVRPAYSVRFLGRDLTKLPERDLLRLSVEALYAQQIRFPLNTANNLRGRLRRLNLAVYKRGAKGVSYVCAVKRHFRTNEEVLAENLTNLIDFIEAHPKMKSSDLPREYLGITGTEAKVETSETASDSESADTAELETASSENKSAHQPQDELKALSRDLRYLVSQGYVIEYSDGRLEVPPVKEEPVAEKTSKAMPEAEQSESDEAVSDPSMGQAVEPVLAEANDQAAPEAISASEPPPEPKKPIAPEAEEEPEQF